LAQTCCASNRGMRIWSALPEPDIALGDRSPKQGVTMDQSGSLDWSARALLAWHMAILRFAVTRKDADRLSVLFIAAEIDRLDRQYKSEPDFSFFRRTSSQLCAAILERSETAGTILRQYLARIDDARLKRVLAAALRIDCSEPAPARGPRTSSPALWKGLPSRGGIRA
jgi:hypothetical protein